MSEYEGIDTRKPQATMLLGLLTLTFISAATILWNAVGQVPSIEKQLIIISKVLDEQNKLLNDLQSDVRIHELRLNIIENKLEKELRRDNP